MTNLRIISRSEWGARYDNGFGPRSLPSKELWLHHSVTIAPDILPPFDDDFKAIRDLEQIGEDRFGRGISYTWIITPAGLIFEGHGPDRVGSHTANHNTVASAICLLGNYDIISPPLRMLRSIAWLMQHAKRQGLISRAILDGGHRDLKSTACPGKNAYNKISIINALAAGPAITEVDMELTDRFDLINRNGNYRESHTVAEAIAHPYFEVADTYKHVVAMKAKLDILANEVSDDEAKILAAFRSGIPAVFSPEQMQELKDAIKEAQTDEAAEAVVNKFWERLTPNTTPSA